MLVCGRSVIPSILIISSQYIPRLPFIVINPTCHAPDFHTVACGSTRLVTVLLEVMSSTGPCRSWAGHESTARLPHHIPASISYILAYALSYELGRRIMSSRIRYGPTVQVYARTCYIFSAYSPDSWVSLAKEYWSHTFPSYTHHSDTEKMRPHGLRLHYSDL